MHAIIFLSGQSWTRRKSFTQVSSCAHFSSSLKLWWRNPQQPMSLQICHWRKPLFFFLSFVFWWRPLFLFFLIVVQKRLEVWCDDQRLDKRTGKSFWVWTKGTHTTTTTTTRIRAKELLLLDSQFSLWVCCGSRVVVGLHRLLLLLLHLLRER